MALIAAPEFIALLCISALLANFTPVRGPLGFISAVTCVTLPYGLYMAHATWYDQMDFIALRWIHPLFLYLTFQVMSLYMFRYDIDAFSMRFSREIDGADEEYQMVEKQRKQQRVPTMVGYDGVLTRTWEACKLSLFWTMACLALSSVYTYLFIARVPISDMLMQRLDRLVPGWDWIPVLFSSFMLLWSMERARSADVIEVACMAYCARLFLGESIDHTDESAALISKSSQVAASPKKSPGRQVIMMMAHSWDLVSCLLPIWITGTIAASVICESELAPSVIINMMGACLLNAVFNILMYIYFGIRSEVEAGRLINLWWMLFWMSQMGTLVLQETNGMPYTVFLWPMCVIGGMEVCARISQLHHQQ